MSVTTSQDRATADRLVSSWRVARTGGTAPVPVSDQDRPAVDRLLAADARRRAGGLGGEDAEAADRLLAAWRGRGGETATDPAPAAVADQDQLVRAAAEASPEERRRAAQPLRRTSSGPASPRRTVGDPVTRTVQVHDWGAMRALARKHGAKQLCELNGVRYLNEIRVGSAVRIPR